MSVESVWKSIWRSCRECINEERASGFLHSKRPADVKWRRREKESDMREYCYFPEFLILDMDGDGKSEVAVYHGGSDSLRQRIVTYRQIHGKPERSFSIGP